MKYFIGNAKFHGRSDIDRVLADISDKTFEVGADSAREMYMIWGEHNDYSNDALEQLPLAFWKQGKLVELRHYDLWCDELYYKELFKRRLNVSLAKEKIL